jgi:hypothetical protein
MAIKVANNQSLTAITALPSAITAGAMTLLSTQTASSSATISFTSGIDSTYKEYVFRFYDIHPATDQQQLTFQVDTGTNTSYNQTITSSVFQAYHNEGDTAAVLTYVTGYDQAQGTAFQLISEATGNANDECVSGYLHLFDPSNATFVKHFIGRTQAAEGTGYSGDTYAAGYVNTTTAITRVQFKMASGNMDSGVIKLYGIS